MLILSVMDTTLAEEFGGTVSIWDEIKPVPEDPISRPKRNSNLNFRVHLADNQRIMLSDGSYLDKLPGHVTVSPATGDIEKDAMGIGVMSFKKGLAEESIPDFYWIQVALPQSQFETLLASARAGRVPSTITVNERGMTLPDEFSKKWDEKASPSLHISSIGFSVLLAEHKIHDEARLSELSIVTQAIQRINIKLKWIIILVAVGAAIVVLQTFQ